MKVNIKNSIHIVTLSLLYSGCSFTQKTTADNNKILKNEPIRTVYEYNNNVKSKIVPAKALKATVYPINNKKNGTFMEKHEVYYWVSKAKFRGQKKLIEKDMNSKILDFINEK